MNSMLLPVVIAGTGSATPERVVTNEELADRIDTSDEWIRERTGIRERRLAAPGEATSDLATAASRRALEAARLQPADIGLVIVATITPDCPTPSTACIVQERLGIPRAAAFDLQAACTGFLYSLETAASLLRAGLARHALVIGAETLSKVTDWEDRTTCVLFGDGAGAVVLSLADAPADGAPRPGLLRSVLRANGAVADILQIPGGGSRLPASAESIAARQHFLKMRGKEVFRHAVRNMEDAATELLEAEGARTEDIALIVPHQANLRIIDALASYLNVPASKFFVNLERYGNTSAASIPLALDEAVRSGRIASGQLALLVAFGAGLTWGAVLLRWK